MATSKHKSVFPLWLRVSASLYLAVFIPLYWVMRGPANFLWFTDIALIVIVICLWTEAALPTSMMAVATLLFEAIWNLDFMARLLFGTHLLGMGATAYIFSPDLPLAFRVFSVTVHVMLPVLLVYTLYRLSYDRRAWLAQTLLTWLLLPVCYFFTDPERNINWVFGIGSPQTLMPPLLYLIFEMVVIPLLVYYPTHCLLQHWFTDRRHAS